MKAGTELLLYQLLWVGETLTRPTLGALSDGFEGWAYRSGLLRTIQRLEAMQILETEGKSLDRVVRLTTKGHRLAVGARDPVAQWSSCWDRKWRMVLFDIPEGERKLRDKLRRELGSRHFGCLQKSVWISPSPMDDLAGFLRRTQSGLGSFTLMESELLPGQKDREVVEIAWNFDLINDGYRHYIDVLGAVSKSAGSRSLEEVLAEERVLWKEVMLLDPLLPDELLPRDYLGKKAYKHRQKVVSKLVSAVF